jgi:hypothetical protein
MTRPVHLEEPLRDYKYDNPWQKKGQGGES